MKRDCEEEEEEEGVGGGEESEEEEKRKKGKKGTQKKDPLPPSLQGEFKTKDALGAAVDVLSRPHDVKRKESTSKRITLVCTHYPNCKVRAWCVFRMFAHSSLAVSGLWEDDYAEGQKARRQPDCASTTMARFRRPPPSHM